MANLLDPIDFVKLADVVFNGRPADTPPRPSITWKELIDRGVSHVRINGKVYRIEVREVESKP
jgi:hypothetical protein